MNITTLEAYVAQMNTWRAVFKKQPLSLLNSRDRQEIAEHIDSDLSPENLSCDGELSPAMVREKFRRLSRVAEQLKSIDSDLVIQEYDGYYGA